MTDTAIQFVVTAGDVAIASIVLFIIFTLWTGVFLYLFFKGDNK